MSERIGRRWRLGLVVGIAAGAGVLTLSTFGLAGTANSDDTTPTTVVGSDAAVLPAAKSPLAEAATLAVSLVWADATVTGATEVIKGGANYVDISGKRADGSSFVLSVYRTFDRAELDSAGMKPTTNALGTTWVGATDEDLTSVYHLSNAGTGVWLGVTPAFDSKAPSAGAVSLDAENLALSPAIVALSQAAG